jgi:photosystem II stability/assembly factor-like uncharacterized protein
MQYAEVFTMNPKAILLRTAAVLTAISGIAALPLNGAQAKSNSNESVQNTSYAGSIFTPHILSAPASGADVADSGTWVRQAQEYPIEIVDFSRSADASHIWGVGPFGRVLMTTDGGQNWTPSNVGNNSATLHSVDFVDDQVGWAVGEGGTGGLVYKTTDGGVSWFQQTEPSGQRVFGVEALDPETVMIVGGGTYFTIARRSTDGGQTWNVMDVPLNDSIFLDIFFVNPQIGWVVGLNGGIAKTTDGGLTWTRQTAPTSWGLIRVHFSDPLNGWAGGYYDILFHTTDGGQTWVKQEPGLPDFTHVLGVATISQHVAWIVGYGGGAQSRPYVKKTTDGGNSWVTQTPVVGPYDGFASALFLDEDNGWAAGAAGLWRHSGSTSPAATATPPAMATATATAIKTVTSIPASSATSIATATTRPANTAVATSTAQATATAQVPATASATAASASATATSQPQATATAVAQCDASFSDVRPGDYFYEGVRYLYCGGAISGYQDGTFRPYDNATRGQLAKIITLAEQWALEVPQDAHFSDVPAGSTFYPFVETAYSHGVIGGYEDGTFRPNNNVTRGQIAKIIVLARGWQPVNAGEDFSDVPAGSTFHPFVEAAYAHGILSGYEDGTFRPGNNATRGQIAKIVHLAESGAR